MDRRKLFLGLSTAAALVASATVGHAQTETRAPDPARTVHPLRAADYKPPAAVDFRSVTIMSDGVRLHGEVFTPADVMAGVKLPAVIMAHGWGGVAAYLRADAADIARAGYFVLVFDYRGWGESGSPVSLIDAEPPHTPGEATPFTARVQPLREYINPLEQAEAGSRRSTGSWVNRLSTPARWDCAVPATPAVTSSSSRRTISA